MNGVLHFFFKKKAMRQTHHTLVICLDIVQKMSVFSFYKSLCPVSLSFPLNDSDPRCHGCSDAVTKPKNENARAARHGDRSSWISGCSSSEWWWWWWWWISPRMMQSDEVRSNSRAGPCAPPPPLTSPRTPHLIHQRRPGSRGLATASKGPPW